MSDETAAGKVKPIEPNYRLAEMKNPQLTQQPSDEQLRKIKIEILAEKLFLSITPQIVFDYFQENEKENRQKFIDYIQDMAERFVKANEPKEGETNG